MTNIFMNHCLMNLCLVSRIIFRILCWDVVVVAVTVFTKRLFVMRVFMLRRLLNSYLLRKCPTKQVASLPIDNKKELIGLGVKTKSKKKNKVAWTLHGIWKQQNNSSKYFQMEGEISCETFHETKRELFQRAIQTNVQIKYTSVFHDINAKLKL